MNTCGLVGLKVRIHSNYKFGEDTTGLIIAPKEYKEDQISILIDGEDTIKVYAVPKAFANTLSFEDEDSVPIEIREEIVLYKNKHIWDNIVDEYLNDIARIHCTKELEDLDYDMNLAKGKGYVKLVYADTIVQGYHEFLSRARIEDNEYSLREALQHKIDQFNSEIVKILKTELLNEKVRIDDYVNGIGLYEYPKDFSEFIEHQDNSIIKQEIEEKKRRYSEDIVEGFMSNYYQRGEYTRVIEELRGIQEDIILKYDNCLIQWKYYPKFITILENSAKGFPEDHPNGFEGLIHITEIENLIKIFNDGLLKSRACLEKSGQEFLDAAMEEALDKTQEWVKECTRFYYAFNTPTYYRAKYEEPVGLVFDPTLLAWDNAIYIYQSAATEGVTIKYSIKEAVRFDWSKVFHRGRYDNRDPNNWSIKKSRNRDFLINGNVPIKYIKKIYFPNETISKKVNRAIGDKLIGIEQEINSQKFLNCHKQW